MVGLDFPIMFLDIEGLEQRWKCGLSQIEALAETDQLRFCLRPAALEVALAKISTEDYSRTVKKLTNMYIDHRYIYLMFKDKERKIEITHVGNCDIKEIIKGPLRVDFFDLVIPMVQVEEFEYKNSSNYEKSMNLNCCLMISHVLSGVARNIDLAKCKQKLSNDCGKHARMANAY